MEDSENGIYLCDDMLKEEERAQYEALHQMEVLFKYEDNSTGYGHHSNEYILKDENGRFWAADSNGCSCEGNCSWVGPLDTADKAWEYVSEMYREQMRQAGPAGYVVE